MTTQDNGGPAFPPTHDPETHCFGMTLRDYFAAKALPSVYFHYCESASKVGFDEDWKMGVALDAYAMADAMLEARK